MLQDAWANLQVKGPHVDNIWFKLKEMKLSIKQWQRTEGKRDSRNIPLLETEIERMEKSLQADAHEENIRKLVLEKKAALWSWYRLEEQAWRQKSRVKWLQEGDRNTKFFHLMASHRRNVNAINKLTIQGRVVDNPDDLKTGIADHFESFFNHNHGVKLVDWDCNLKRLRNESAAFLEQPFSEEEVWGVVHSGNGNKAPGPDGFNMHFIKEHWGMIKGDVMKQFEVFFSSGKFDKRLNNSFIALIPKCASPTCLNMYRPISLVGCIYKIVAKVLANRLRRVMEEVVGDNQFSFVSGKQILDCCLVANEVIDTIKKSGLGGLLFKVDFEKAYDSVEWQFLDLVMGKMNFGKKWRKWIMTCVSTVSLSVLVNGVPSRQFNTSRGLRQGCPMSPFLFNLVAEALSSLLQGAIGRDLFSGIMVGNGRTMVSHLQYADDTIIFCKADQFQLMNVKRTLRCYQAMSGLKVNFQKSCLYGINMCQQTLSGWADAISCKMACLPSTYLGLPLGANLNSTVAWGPVVAKFENRLAGWKSMHLSMGGRVVMLKSVLTSLPVYFMSLFQIPASVKNELDRIQKRFLWGGPSAASKIHWVHWKDVCSYTEYGGLGFVQISLKNRALLNKWIWRYGAEPKALWRAVIDSKYGGSRYDLLPSTRQYKRFSSLWRNITKPLFLDNVWANEVAAGLGFSLGDGDKIRFWQDNWTDKGLLCNMFPRMFALAVDKVGTIKDFGSYSQGKWVWSIIFRRSLFGWELQQWYNLCTTLKGFAACDSLVDSLIWKGSVGGNYSAKQFCNHVLGKDSHGKDLWKMIWVSLAPPKVEIFCWQMMRGRIAVKEQLARRGLIDWEAASCSFCKAEVETIEHLFFSCIASWKVWMHCCSLWGVHWVSHIDPKVCFRAWQHALPISQCNKAWGMAFFATIWSLWLMRNDIVFNNKDFNYRKLLDNIHLRIASWFKAKWPRYISSLSDLARCPNLAKAPLKVKQTRIARSWNPPPYGFLKFNVDGSSLGKPGPAGIGGVLRNNSAAVKVVFSKSIGVADSNVAELLAIREAMHIFLHSLWMKSHKIIFESDSSNVVKWIHNPQSAPWSLKKFISHIEALKIQLKEWDLVLIPRESNEMADALAKAGVYRSNDLLVSYGQ